MAVSWTYVNHPLRHKTSFNFFGTCRYRQTTTVFSPRILLPPAVSDPVIGNPMSPLINPLATCQPTCNARTWLSQPHPYLPIIATACSDMTVRIYNLKTFQQEGQPIGGGHKRSVRSVAWKCDGTKGESTLATGSFDASAGIWKRWDQEHVRGEKQEMDFMGGMAGGGEDEGGDADDEDEWRLEVILDGHDSEIKSLAFCPVAPLLATCSRDKSVWIWEELDEGENFETVAVLQDHSGDVKCVAWHPTEQLLASGSYDDDVRIWREDLDDWACCALLRGHQGTVWWVEFEGTDVVQRLKDEAESGDDRSTWLEEREKSGPRLMTCSDDKTIRLWRRKPKEKVEPPTGQGRLPTIWKNRNFEEEWFEEARLPQIHDRPIYSISWSKKTGRAVSAGSDGLIVVYEERWASKTDVEMKDESQTAETNGEPHQQAAATEWVVVAEIQNAHDVFEVNHVVWAPRADKERRSEDEEVIVSTSDDGEVKIWTLGE